jgi:uncharacterized surface protein with fasciclin (FAS1) repeats
MIRALVVAALAMSLVACQTTKTAVSEAKKALATKDIVTLAAEDGQFSKLVTAIKTAGLEDTLRGEGPFTVFAPTDDAFAKLPEGTLGKLLQDKAQLTKILTYHVVPAVISSDKIVSGGSVQTVEGGSITAKVDGKQVMINDANVVKADIFAKNGVIHAIDTVLIPK